MRFALPAALLAAITVSVGCSASQPPTAPEPTASVRSTPAGADPSEPATRDASPAPEVTVPLAVGGSVSDVRRLLVGTGLRPRVVSRRPLCVPGVVLAQDPPAGTRVATGAEVGVVVSRMPAAATCIVPPAPPAAEALRAWARGTAPAPAFAPDVTVWVANRVAARLVGAAASRRESWVLDVAYAEQVQVRVLDALAGTGMTGRRVPPVSCVVRDRPTPARLLGRLPWSWTLATAPGRVRSCLDVVAVQVWVDDQRRITDVGFLSGSP